MADENDARDDRDAKEPREGKKKSKKKRWADFCKSHNGFRKYKHSQRSLDILKYIPSFKHEVADFYMQSLHRKKVS
jgi:hypothetical protein